MLYDYYFNGLPLSLVHPFSRRLLLFFAYQKYLV